MKFKIPKCTECGACCSNPMDKKWVEVTESDKKRIEKKVGEENIHQYIKDGDIEKYSMQTYTDFELDEVCFGFTGNIGDGCSCKIYDVRPSVCRKFKRGSKYCIYFLGMHKIKSIIY